MKDIVYVDEQREEAKKVIRAACLSKQFDQNQIVGLQPATSIEETIELILTNNCKALITDYRLDEFAPDVCFNGADLIREWQQRFDCFPCFVVTAFSGQATNEHLDPNIIFSKSDLSGDDLMSENESNLPFFLRVRKKIDWYENLVSDMQQELRQLASKEEPLSPQEVEKMIEYDHKLEKMLWAKSTITREQKRASLKEFPDLLNSVSELIADIKKGLEGGEQSK